MSEFVSGFRTIPDEELQPPKPSLEPSRFHDIPLYVVARMMPSSNEEPTIITLPGGRLMTGLRTIARSIEQTANEITREQGIITSADAHLHLPNGHNAQVQGFSVKRVLRTACPDMADFTHHPVYEHNLPLELHVYSKLVEQLEATPGREIDAAYLRAFGRRAIKNVA